MKKRDYDKRVLHDFKLYNTQEIEEYLNKMAEKGFFLLEMNSHQMFFKKEEPRKLRHSVILTLNIEDQKRYEEYSKHVGWNVVCTSDKLQVYATEDAEIPFVESDETKFEMLQTVRKKRMTYDGILLSLLIMFAVLTVDYSNGFIIGSLSTVGLCTEFICLFMVVLLISEIVEFLYWKNQCCKKLRNNEKLHFRYSILKKRLNQIMYILINICFIILMIDSFYRLVQSFQTDGIRRSKGLLINSLLIAIVIPLSEKLHGKFSKRGTAEQILFRVLIMIIGFVIITVSINWYGSGTATYPPNTFQLTDDKGFRIENISTGKSVLGSKEDYSLISFNESSIDTLEYSYHIYRSKFPWIMNHVKKELLKAGNISKDLSIYKQIEDATIYIAHAQEEESEIEITDTFIMDLEYYDGCLLIEKKNELLIFYYKNFNNKNLEDMLHSFGYKE